ncbi:MAG: alcohol dehydrogenase catalytic domain-containing protein [Burkholderiales bacterium]
MSEAFKAFRVFNENNTVAGRVVDTRLEDLSPGEVVFKTAYSSVNYKDALAATGAGGKIIRKYPLTGGIDAAGVVVSSSDARFKAGDEVICTSYDMGVAHDGGYGQYCRVPADWVVPLPQGLSLFEAMALGTAGYTAGLAVELLELNGLAPSNGKVLVNGATGGVATLAIDMLARQG